MSLESIFAEARTRSEEVVSELARRVDDELREDRSVLETTTIYVTGSAARGEMSEYSDVDLFVVQLADNASYLEDAVITTSIWRALRAMRKPTPSKDGRFLRMQLAKSLVDELGTDKDDFYNHFTARMLLLLESRPLLAGTLHEALVQRVLERYWKDAAKHSGDHVPYLLVNDIVRYWRILLLNYAAKVSEQDADTPERRLQSYKLRCSRCLMCFSALTDLTAEYRVKPNIEINTAVALTRRTPLERLDHIIELVPETHGQIRSIKAQYAQFLEHTAKPKQELLHLFEDPEYRRARSGEGRAFCEAMFDLMMYLGSDRGREMLRIVVV